MRGVLLGIFDDQYDDDLITVILYLTLTITADLRHCFNIPTRALREKKNTFSVKSFDRIPMTRGYTTLLTAVNFVA